MLELIDLLKNTVKDIAVGNGEEYSENIKTIEALLLSRLPSIISLYFDPKMQEYAMDAPKWPSRYEKLMKTIDSEDLFQVIDVLYYEFYLNLVDLMNILDQRGIAHE